MPPTYSTVQSAGYPLLSPESTATGSEEWPVSTYVWTVAVAGVLALLAVGAGYLVGYPLVGGLAIALPIGLLILWRPEIGLFLMVVYIPFEVLAQVPGVFTVTKALGILTFLSLVPRLIAGRRAGLNVPGLWLAVAFAAWCMVTVVGATSSELAWLEILTRVQMVGLVFVAVVACYDESRAKALFTFLFLGAVLAAAGAVFLTPKPTAAWTLARATIGTGDVNEHAKNLMSGIFIAPFLIAISRRWLRLLLALGLALAVVGLVRTGSRGGYVSVVVGIVAMLLSFRNLRMGRRLLLAVVVSVGLVLFVVLGTVLGFWEMGLWGRVAQLWERGFSEGGRLHAWYKTFLLGAEHPLTGVGIGNHGLYLWGRGTAVGARVAHNDFFTHFADTGLPGLLLYVSFLVAVLLRAWRTSQPWLRAGLIGLFTAAVVSSMANPSYGTKGFWLQLAACLVGGTVFGAAAPAQPEPKAGAPGLALPRVAPLGPAGPA